MGTAAEWNSQSMKRITTIKIVGIEKRYIPVKHYVSIRILSTINIGLFLINLERSNCYSHYYYFVYTKSAITGKLIQYAEMINSLFLTCLGLYYGCDVV